MTTAAFRPPASGGVLVASPSTQVRDRVLRKLAERRGPVHIASGGAEALAKLESGDWQMLFLDRQLPDLDAEELAVIIEQGKRSRCCKLTLGQGTCANCNKCWSGR